MARFDVTSIRDRLNISRLAIRFSWLTICGWVAVAVVGVFAFGSLKYALFPDITFPVVVVNATAALETPLATETRLTTPIERQLQPLADLKRTASSTTAGRTVINLRFRVGTALAEATAAVEQALAQVALPPSADYEVIPLNLNEATAVTYALLSETRSLAELAELTEETVLPPLQEIAGVLRVDVLGTGTRSDDAGGDFGGDFLAALQQSPTWVRFDGTAALALQVVKQGQANTLEVVDRVAEALGQVQADLPEVQFIQAATQADYIRAATRATLDSLLGAVAIAVVVILAFLRDWRATLITALAIPLSLLGTCIVMAMSGFNLETITLLALALVIGIIVDDAIVEIENISRHLALGASPRQAALRATQEIGLTVSASTLTIVAVFLPVAFMGGTVGQFFKPFGLTVSAAVLTSLLVARTLSPVLAARWLKPRRPDPARPGLPAAAEAPVSQLEQGYSRLLFWALHHRWRVIAIALVSFIAGIAIIPLIPQGFIPELDRGEFYLNYTVPLPTASLPQIAKPVNPTLSPTLPNEPATALPVDPRDALLQQTLAQAEPLEAAVFDLPEVASVLTTVGAQGRPDQGSLYIKLRDDRALGTAAVQARLRQTLPQLDGVTTSIEAVQFIDTGGEKPLQVALLGENLTALNQAAAEVKAEVEGLPGFADVRVSGEGEIGAAGTGETGAAGTISEINRQNGQRVAYISANLIQGKALGDATDQVVALAQAVIPPGVQIDLGGDSARIGEVLGSFGRTLVLAVICMLGVLLIPFGRLLEPAVVGLSLPLSVVGAMLALLVTQSDFGLVSVLGLLFLLGLLDKNALLLMDSANQLRRAGMKRTEAILKTGLVRLRPILMTTASTVLGMVPIALGLGAGAELRQPMAVAIIGGLLTSTLLSLLVVPVLYSLLEDGWQGLMRRVN